MTGSSDPPPRRPHLHLRPWLIALATLLLLLAAGAAYVASVLPRAPSESDLRQVRAPQPSVLLSADGQVLATFRQVQQQPVALGQISPTVVNALIATEDRRFYEHHGVDWQRLVAAAWNTARGDTQGASTITQQLARNLFPEEIGRSRNLTRKLKEMVTALRIERIYSKPQILERYLNSTPFLYNAVGIEMAARTYFDKSASELDVGEAAMLVGMLKGTYYYNPVLFPERARQRRNLVLQQMRKAGMLNETDYVHWRDAPLKVTLNRQDDDLGPAPHFAAYARRWLLDWAQAHDLNLYTDGLVVRSTLDTRLQRVATQSLEQQAQALQQVADVEWSSRAMPQASGIAAYAALHKKAVPFRHFFVEHPELLDAFLRDTPEYKRARQAGTPDAQALKQLKSDDALVARVRAAKTRLEAAFVAMDPATGEIKAWVGSRDFDHGQFDHVAQAVRQPGSTFKPIVYGAALEAGIDPDRTYLDGPVEVRLDADTVWRPTDMHGSTGEMMTLRDGLVYSKNTITAQVMQDVGVPRIVSLAQAMGVDQSRLDPVPSLALGTSPVTLLEMVDAYSTIADEGTRHKPLFIRRISDHAGHVLAEFTPQASRAMSADTAVDLIDMLRGVVDRGTGTIVRTRFGIQADVGGKTGTTQNNTDGWFILMHPRLVAGAWVGFDDQRITLRSNYWGQGGHNAALVVGDFFHDALKTKLLDTRAHFPPPHRPAPVITTYSPDEVDDSYGRIDDVVPGSGDAQSAQHPDPPVQRAIGDNGVPVFGDDAGVAALRRSNGSPKSDEELERALARRRAPPALDDVLPSGSVSTSGTSAARPASAAPASAPAPAPVDPAPAAPPAQGTPVAPSLAE